MGSNKLEEKEKEEIVRDIVNRDYRIMRRLLEVFEPSIERAYNKEIKSKYIISKKDFHQEVRTTLCKRIKKFRGTSYGEIKNFVEKTISLCAIDTRKKYKKNLDRHIYLEDLDTESIKGLDIISKISVEEQVIRSIITKLIRKKINEILEEHEKITLGIILDQVNLRVYADENGTDYEKLRRDRRNLINKFRKNKELKSILEIYRN